MWINFTKAPAPTTLRVGDGIIERFDNRVGNMVLKRNKCMRRLPAKHIWLPAVGRSAIN